jgi:hypothetical protein
MGRVVRQESAARKREKLIRAIAHTLRQSQLRKPSEPELYDMLAFINLALEEICVSIDDTTAAWEKRDYWLKADRFRRQWQWTATGAENLRRALELGDISLSIDAITQFMPQLIEVKIGPRIEKTTPWEHAYQAWHTSSP